MTDRDEETERHETSSGAEPPPPAGSGAPTDPGLTDLRERLGELQSRVELLGSQGVWPQQPDPPSSPPPVATEYAYGSPAPFAEGDFGAHGQPPEGAPTYELPRYGRYDPALGQPQPYPPLPQPPGPPFQQQQPPFEEPQPLQQPFWEQPAVPRWPEAGPGPVGWEQPYEQPLTYPAPPAATTGHPDDTAEISEPSSTVALVDAGPFDDLIQLRHFEDELTSLDAVRDVRVRRFGHGRASIEVGMTGHFALGRELGHLHRPMQVSDAASGAVVVELALPPSDPPAAAGERAEATSPLDASVRPQESA